MNDLTDSIKEKIDKAKAAGKTSTTFTLQVHKGQNEHSVPALLNQAAAGIRSLGCSMTQWQMEANEDGSKGYKTEVSWE